jgi:hypothetical protein
MQSQKPSLLLRFLPSLTDLAFLGPLLILFGLMDGAHTILRDGDTGWHIRNGEWILQNGRVPDKDLFSFTKTGESWFAWEWLWDVIFGWLHQHGGMTAVVLVSIFVICLTSALLFRLVRRKCNHDFIAFAVTLVATAGCSLHWLARPHLVTLLFVVIFYSILERVREGRTRLLFFLPLLTVLWTNLHGGFLTGVILIGAYAGGELLAWGVQPGKDERKIALARSKPYLITAVTCFLASLLNPYGYHLHEHIYRYLTDPFYLRYINEFKSISFQNPAALYFEVMILIGAVAAFRCLGRKQFAYVLLFVGWCHLALTSARHIPIFLIVAAPFVALALRELLMSLKEAAVAGWLRRSVTAFENYTVEFGVMDRVERVHLISTLALLVLAAVIYAPASPPKFRAEFDPEKFPAGALEELRSAELSQRIFTEDLWGGYLIYHLYPATRVFIDGRSDFYGPEFVKDFLGVMSVKHDWEKLLDRHGINTMLLPVGTPLAGALKETERWRRVYDDGVAIVFRSEGSKR